MSEQLTDAWFAERAGKVTASRLGDLMARTKSGYGASRVNYMAELLVERLTGLKAEKFQNDAMRWGVETEPQARDAYCFQTDADVEQVGFISHPRIAMTGASPDGQIDVDGLIEIKCPNTAAHIETMLSGTISVKYIYQMQWQMVCTERRWCDYVSFDPRMPAHMRLFVKRINRDDVLVSTLEKEVAAFLAELDSKIGALTAKYPEAA